MEYSTKYDVLQVSRCIVDSTDSQDGKVDTKLESSPHVKLDHMDYTPQNLTPSVVITKYDVMKAEEFLSPDVPSDSDMMMEVEVSSGAGLAINSDALYEVDADVKQDVGSDSDVCAESQSQNVPGPERMMCNDEIPGEILSEKVKSEKLMSDKMTSGEVMSDSIKQEMTSDNIKQEENIKLEEMTPDEMPSEKIKQEQMTCGEVLLDMMSLDTETSVQVASNSPDCADIQGDVSVDYDDSTDCEGNVQEEMTHGAVRLVR